MSNTATETAPQVSAFDQALENIRAIQSTYEYNATDLDHSKKALQTATRVAAWLAYDLAKQSDDATATGEAMAKQIAEARNVKPEAIKVYAQRGRDMVKPNYASAMAKADREKTDPLTLAKKLREQGAKKASEDSAKALVTNEAREILAGKRQMTLPQLDIAMATDKDAVSYTHLTLPTILRV